MTTVHVVFPGEQPEPADLLLCAGVNMRTGEPVFRQYFDGPTSLEADLLRVATAVFCSDVAIRRGERESIARHIKVSVPVVNVAAFDAAKGSIQYALYLLSHDSWDLTFRPRPGSVEAPGAIRQLNEGKVLLFSGGLDSLAAAVQQGELGETTSLVSHVTGNRVVSGVQNELGSYLEYRFPSLFKRYSFRVGGVSRPIKGFPFPSDDAREDSQRTRSFLFLALASVVARRKGVGEIVMIAENGQMAIHLPLSAARIGAFSTHTAHPEFVWEAAALFSSLLRHPLRIENPFLYMTKAESIAALIERHQTVIARAISCWKSSRVQGGQRHCGVCLPCLVRRIAVEANGLRINEYQRDLLSQDIATLPPDDDGKRNVVELCEFVSLFSNSASQALLEEQFPELINPRLDSSLAVAMYRRFAAEAKKVFDVYPAVARIA